MGWEIKKIAGYQILTTDSVYIHTYVCIYLGIYLHILTRAIAYMCVCVIIIIIMSRYQLGYLWPLLATPPYCPLLPADSQGYIPHRHRAAVCRFELDVLPLLVHVKESTGVHHLWARPYFSSSVPHVWFI